MSVTPLPRDPEKEQPPRTPRRSPPPAPGKAPSLLESFNYAVEGIIHVLRTQRNLRIHFLAAILVMNTAPRDDLDVYHRLRCVPVDSACCLYASTIRCTSL